MWRVVNREEKVLIAIISINGIIFGSSQLIIPLYLKELGLNSAMIGLFLTGQMLISSLIAVILSVLGDAYGRRKFLFMSRGISILGMSILFIGIPFGILISSMMSAGGLISAIMAEKSKNLDRSLSLAFSFNVLLSIFGSLLPLFLSLRYIILTNALILSFTTLLLLFVKEGYKGTGKVDLRLKSIGKIGKLSVESLIGLGAGMILPIMSLWFYLRFNVTAQEMSPVFAASNASLALSMLFAPRLSRMFGRVKSIIYTHIIGIILLIFLPLSGSYIMASLIFVLRNTAMNMTGPIFRSFILNLIPEEERARGSSLINLIDALPRSAGPSFGGYFFYLGQLSTPFFITAALYSVATIGFYIFFKNVD